MLHLPPIKKRGILAACAFLGGGVVWAEGLMDG